ncbi:N-acetylmuramoyl-L-alanine amidase [Serpentinicella sp. ANB-PHB4]|uniref:N-acetylmuramoyl-L-alanine amidase n=1 Tax=Serpentinicella sp. ANB-PHB4 TaxID=3074076 RepID=UPI00285BF34B|nr:N-acetylmuramoyl-L-alanine amidase [Serpentinicella sp. ANB-PHB4]MDR5659139.1 N-acetylmuramoyl-L-alanine amidase [Serpentinicella sp. ANB-PHB4]
MHTEGPQVKIYDVEKDIVSKKPFDELLKELVASSAPLTFHIESLKSLAIVMRTNIKRAMRLYGGKGIGANKEADISTENYPDFMELEKYKNIWGKDFNVFKEKLNKAITETDGQVIYLNNKLINAKFHPVCGGATENSENVEGNIVKYLRKVLCNQCRNTPYYIDHKDVNIEDIEKKLGVKFVKDSSTKNMMIENIFEDIVRDEEGRIKKVKIGGKEFKGKDIVELLGLNSTRFSWKPQKIRFFTQGKGDGLGLCLFGANNLAMEGKAAEDIIKYYYTGVNVGRIKKISINKPMEGKTIVIDPGHGGEKSEDHISSAGLREKEINLEISNNLKQKLIDLGAKVYLTREEDTYVPLGSRAALANSKRPDFFISIHQNYIDEPKIMGTEIYYYPGDHQAKRLANSIMNQLATRLQRINRGVKEAEFYLLRDVKVSTLHIETAYLSSPREEKLLMNLGYKKDVAEAIAQGIVDYYFV